MKGVPCMLPIGIKSAMHDVCIAMSCRSSPPSSFSSWSIMSFQSLVQNLTSSPYRSELYHQSWHQPGNQLHRSRRLLLRTLPHSLLVQFTLPQTKSSSFWTFSSKDRERPILAREQSPSDEKEEEKQPKVRVSKTEITSVPCPHHLHSMTTRPVAVATGWEDQAVKTKTSTRQHLLFGPHRR
jgi:hypothetical protein